MDKPCKPKPGTSCIQAISSQSRFSNGRRNYSTAPQAGTQEGCSHRGRDLRALAALVLRLGVSSLLYLFFFLITPFLLYASSRFQNALSENIAAIDLVATVQVGEMFLQHSEHAFEVIALSGMPLQHSLLSQWRARGTAPRIPTSAGCWPGSSPTW